MFLTLSVLKTEASMPLNPYKLFVCFQGNSLKLLSPAKTTRNEPSLQTTLLLQDLPLTIPQDFLLKWRVHLKSSCLYLLF